MSTSSKYRGYYCPRCHTYSRIYFDRSIGRYVGTCPRCSRHVTLPAYEAEARLFHSAGRNKRKLINIRDDYRSGKIIGQLEAGTPAKVIEKRDYNSVTWYRIRAGSLEGWVSGTFIRPI